MKKILLVDDDAVVTRVYRDRLSAHGFQVNTAGGGTAAITFLRAAKPDLIVLDLMMPDLSGVEVLKFIRGQPNLAATPVVVLTNAYVGDLARQASRIGIQKPLLKSQCSPSVLMACIDEILGAKRPPSAPTPQPDAPTVPPKPPLTPPPPPSHRIQRETPSAVRPTQTPAPAARSARAEAQTSRPVEASGPEAKPSTDLLAHAPVICADLRKLFKAVAQQPRNGPEQKARLQDIYRRVHFLAAAAGLTEHAQLAQTAAVFEALLYVLMNEPSQFSPSVLRTLANLVDFVELLLRRASESLPTGLPSTQVLVVDDDPVSNRLVVSALQQAQLKATCTEDPLVAWQWINHQHFDLILLDIEMPVLNGFELCKRLRTVPGYEHIPVIFVTVHSDFESRAKSSLSGADDLISKPILPMELAAKVVMHLFKRQVRA
jgi:CheY-like chemotaxis protein